MGFMLLLEQCDWLLIDFEHSFTTFPLYTIWGLNLVEGQGGGLWGPMVVERHWQQLQ